MYALGLYCGHGLDERVWKLSRRDDTKELSGE